MKIYKNNEINLSLLILINLNVIKITISNTSS